MPLDELVTSVSGAATSSIAWNSFCLAPSSSWIASIAGSASGTVGSKLGPWCSSSSPRSTIPSVACPSATRARARRGTSIGARSMPRELASNSVTGQPAAAHSAAQPQPMSPAPITATLRGRPVKRSRLPARSGWASRASPSGTPARRGAGVPDSSRPAWRPARAHHRAEKVGRNVFHGYETTRFDNAKVLAILRDEVEVLELKEGEDGRIVLDETPFYAEAGG